MTDLVNTQAALRTFLLTDATLAAKVSSRIWVGTIPDSQFGSMPMTCLMLLASSVIPMRSVPVYGERTDIWCYGATELESWQTYMVLYNALHRCGLQSVSTDLRIMNAWLVGGPTFNFEREVGWPRVWTAWKVMWAESAMS
jgi:hypothetical protein